MSSATVTVIIVVVVLVVALIIAATMTARRRRLQQRFGPEYDRAVSEQDSRLRAEAELTERERRVRKLGIKPLSEAARTRYLEQWQGIQENFVDAPETAVADAYTLVTTVMRERGYPATDDDQAMADLSVEHASTVSHFRAAQEITRNVADGNVDTEELRQALIHYRELFTDLLGEDTTHDLPGAAASGGRHRSESAPDTTEPDGLPIAQPTAEGMPAEDMPAEDVSATYPDDPSDLGEAREPLLPPRVTTPASDPNDPSWQQGR
jgi:Tfp pilus assembly protein PilX